jgi:hypothetical protein
MMQHKHKVQAIVGLWTVMLLIWSSLLSAAPQAELIQFWNTSNEASRAKIDHRAWQSLLDRYLDANQSGVNRFDYAKLKANAADKGKLKGYLKSLMKLDPRTYSKAEQKPYWINLYNALTVHLIVNRYPIESIKKIGWFGLGPWDKELVKIQGKKLTLNNIEHGILRPIWRDNRIHYAVNCASFGCPNLASKAYTAANTERLLEAGAKAYVNHPRGVQFKNGKLLVSSIYHWYEVDFGGNNAGLIKHLQEYAQPALAKRLRGYKGVIDHDYDWRLNKP